MNRPAARNVGASRARGAFILTVGFIALLSAAIWLYWTVEGAIGYQRDVRLAQRARDTVYRAQLDMTSAVRGFAITHDIRSLRPYAEAQRDIAGARADLRSALEALGTPQLIAFANAENAAHERWHAEVAVPFLASDRRVDAMALEAVDRELMKSFRHADRALDEGISTAAALADSAENVALARIAIVTGLLGVAFAGVYFYFSAQRARMSAETSRTRTLYENEKRIADALQAAFVQKALPIIPNLGFHASYTPAGAQARVGGDWYDAFALPDGRILFSIGDVAGHGIEAAVTMSRARQAIIASALHERDPAVVLSRANETLMLQEPTMVTAVCGYIDPVTLQISYATAGHPPPVIARPGRDARFLEHDGIPLGIFADARYGSFTAQAGAGTLLVLYTDGVIEHKRDLIDGERRLLAAAAAAANASDPAWSVRDAIFGSVPPDDDVAIMTISFSVDASASSANINAFAPNRLTIATGEQPTLPALPFPR